MGYITGRSFDLPVFLCGGSRHRPESSSRRLCLQHTEGIGVVTDAPKAFLCGAGGVLLCLSA